MASFANVKHDRMVTDREACADLCKFITDMLHWCDQNGCHDTETVSVSINTLSKMLECSLAVYSSMVHGSAIRVPGGRKSMYDHLCHGKARIDPDKAAGFADMFFAPTGKEVERKELRKSGYDYGLTRNEWPK